MKVWQFATGGGEDDETLIMTAKRELFEETGIIAENFMKLTSMTYIPAFYFSLEIRTAWGIEKSVIPVFCFSVETTTHNIDLSHEHVQYKWADYQTAVELLHFDIDKTALWELSKRLRISGAS
jgi:dATP pyrophosphohydrolase